MTRINDTLDEVIEEPPGRIRGRATDQGYTKRLKMCDPPVNSNNVLEARVPNGRGTTYMTRIDLDKGRFQCTCPAHENYPWPCKHSVAVAMVAKAMQTAELFPEEYVDGIDPAAE